MKQINCPFLSVRCVVAMLCILAFQLVISPTVEAARWYHVELIVFKHLATELSGDEDWSVPDQVPNFATAVDLDGLSDTSGSIMPLSPNAFYLSGVSQQLRASSRYEPVLHKAWAQPGYSANNVRRVYVSSNPASNRDLDNTLDLDMQGQIIEGTVGLQGGRLLHVAANFVLRDGEVRTTIGEFRRIKLKQLHYFDHPLFGVLIRVIPYKVESPE